MGEVQPMNNDTRNVKIHAAATYFACVCRDRTKIARVVGVSERTILRWRDDPEWERTFQVIGYRGTRLFKRPGTYNTFDWRRIWRRVRSLLRLFSG